ncbi:Uncharacterised protein [Mycoplasmopsis maculosa]|uniref:Lipoprotein n=1 Tax=Mycoplasmopsis maculosa TaxID=114885 RepID=A0A449B415_9BACT|nr:hypothetical protein [Mycoplasmopsis maculosa]VEU75342.1 Uncharacterised protein [Mycoplasmopsis maculosa]
MKKRYILLPSVVGLTIPFVSAACSPSNVEEKPGNTTPEKPGNTTPENTNNQFYNDLSQEKNKNLLILEFEPINLKAEELLARANKILSTNNDLDEALNLEIKKLLDFYKKVENDTNLKTYYSNYFLKLNELKEVINKQIEKYKNDNIDLSIINSIYDDFYNHFKNNYEISKYYLNDEKYSFTNLENQAKLIEGSITNIDNILKLEQEYLEKILYFGRYVYKRDEKGREIRTRKHNFSNFVIDEKSKTLKNLINKKYEEITTRISTMLQNLFKQTITTEINTFASDLETQNIYISDLFKKYILTIFNTQELIEKINRNENSRNKYANVLQSFNSTKTKLDELVLNLDSFDYSANEAFNRELRNLSTIITYLPEDLTPKLVNLLSTTNVWINRTNESESFKNMHDRLVAAKEKAQNAINDSKNGNIDFDLIETILNEIKQLNNEAQNLVTNAIRPESDAMFASAYTKMFGNEQVPENERDESPLARFLKIEKYHSIINLARINELKEQYKNKFKLAYSSREEISNTLFPIINELGELLAKPLIDYLNASSLGFNAPSEENFNYFASADRQNVNLILNSNETDIWLGIYGRQRSIIDWNNSDIKQYLLDARNLISIVKETARQSGRILGIRKVEGDDRDFNELSETERRERTIYAFEFAVGATKVVSQDKESITISFKIGNSLTAVSHESDLPSSAISDKIYKFNITKSSISKIEN